MTVEETQTQRQVIGAYKLASTAMKTNQPNIEEAESVMNDLQETMDDHKELEETLGKSVVQQDDGMDLEQELGDLLGEADIVEPVKETTKKPEISDSDLIRLLQGLDVENHQPVENKLLNENVK